MSCPLRIIPPVDPSYLYSNGVLTFKAHQVGLIISNFFTVVSVILSIFLICQHLSNFRVKSEQIPIIRILLMIPIYSISSILAYYFVFNAIYYQLIRDCFESIVIISFFNLLLAYLSKSTSLTSKREMGEITKLEREQNLRLLFHKVKLQHWLFPLRFIKFRPDGAYFLWMMRIGVMNYVIVRPLSTIIAVISEANNIYCAGNLSPKFLYIYCNIAVSLSVTVAMYCVVQLWTTLSKELKPFNPMLKFIAVKSVIFLMFWQSSLLGILGYFNVIKETEYYSKESVIVGIGSILECFEMMLFGILHLKAFPYSTYKTAVPPTNRFKSFLTVLNPSDLGKSILDGLGFMFNSKSIRQSEFKFTRARDLEAIGFEGGRKKAEVDEDGMELRDDDNWVEGEKRDSRLPLLEIEFEFTVLERGTEYQSKNSRGSKGLEVTHDRFESGQSIELPQESFPQYNQEPLLPHQTNSRISTNSPYILPVSDEPLKRNSIFGNSNGSIRTPSIFLPIVHQSSKPLNSRGVNMDGLENKRDSFIFEKY